jgi:hypothetical protein
MNSLGESSDSTTALGDWFASIIYTRQGHYLIFVSEKSRLPLLLSAKGLDTLEPRFLITLHDQLIRYGASEKAVDLEISQMHPIHYGKTNNRSVLGTMNDYVYHFRHLPPLEQNYTIHDWADSLAEIPCGPLGYGFPKELAVQLIMDNLN